MVTPETELANLEAEIAPVRQEIETLEKALAPYYAIRDKISVARKCQQELLENLLQTLDEKCQQLSLGDAEHHILDITRENIASQLERYIVSHRQQVIAAIKNWWDKYHVTLQEIEMKRDEAARELAQYLKGLGYT